MYSQWEVESILRYSLEYLLTEEEMEGGRDEGRDGGREGGGIRRNI